MKNESNENLVLLNFEEAASTYKQHASLQRTMAWKLAKQCRDTNIPNGMWVDLGAGTGLLADAIEAFYPNQQVLRLDGSNAMLNQRRHSSQSQVWDLNVGLPQWPNKPSLLASSFALHWLNNPKQRLEEWFMALAPGGWLAIAVPIKGSFPQWHNAARIAGVTCNAFPLPSKSELLDAIPTQCIEYQQLEQITQASNEVISLLKPMRDIGAHTSPKPAMGITYWRNLQKAWPRSRKNGLAELTWSIQLLMIQR